jgi:hypothetical protein
VVLCATFARIIAIFYLHFYRNFGDKHEMQKFRARRQAQRFAPSYDDESLLVPQAVKHTIRFI